MLKQVRVNREVFGNGENLLVCGSVMKLPEEIRGLAGKVQCVYVDPPFMTGDHFDRSRPYGTKGWKNGSPVSKFPAFDDRFMNERQYIRLLNKLVSKANELLSGTGVFYLHLDWRMAARGKLICDKVFGVDLFLNEIIWAYESGGRSKKTFSRKHDTILMYAKTKKYRFDISKVPLERQSKRKNHMARGIDEDGRLYSYIRSNGKEYRYYDDEPVYPGDVWTDISHLQQRDPERTGYATQKPLKLLKRLLLPVTNPGDRVVDLCCGSGTALEAAQILECRFAGLDVNPEAIAVCQHRLRPKDLTVICPCGGKATLLAEHDAENNRFTIGGLEISHEAFPEKTTPMDNLESWDTGEIRDGVFYAERSFRRSFRYPELQQTLKTAQGIAAVMTTDAAGIRRAYSTK